MADLKQLGELVQRSARAQLKTDWSDRVELTTSGTCQGQGPDDRFFMSYTDQIRPGDLCVALLFPHSPWAASLNRSCGRPENARVNLLKIFLARTTLNDCNALLLGAIAPASLAIVPEDELQSFNRVDVLDGQRLCDRDENRDVWNLIATFQNGSAIEPRNSLKTKLRLGLVVAEHEWEVFGDAAEQMRGAFAAVLGVSDIELKKNLGLAENDTTITRLVSNVETDLAGFRQAFEFGPFGGGRGQASGMIDAARSVALDQFRQTGNAEEARRRAVALIHDHVVVIASPTLRVVVPKDLGLDEAQIEAATAFKQSRAQIDSFDPVSIGTPEAQETGELGKDQAKFRRDRTRSAAANYGVWTANERSDGLVLLVPTTQGGTQYTRLLNSNGDPYEIKFSELKDVADKSKKASAPAIIGRPSGGSLVR